MSIIKKVAKAITLNCGSAGQAFGTLEPQSAEVRAENLLRDSKYGPYIVEGDPYGWTNGNAIATILLEQKGHSNDCHPPLDYWGSGLTVSHRASIALQDYYIEFVNAAVAAVYPV